MRGFIRPAIIATAFTAKDPPGAPSPGLDVGLFTQ